MRFALKDYQTDAVQRILSNLKRAREDTEKRGDLIAFALSATTGAGKTVMATAVFEALFAGSEDFDFDADPNAVVLWVTDDPSLNEQTRFRILECGDRLAESRLKVIGEGPESGFNQEKFDPGNIYFLNIQKLGTATTWVKTSDKRDYTLWDTIHSTIADDSLTLYIVLDEAHKGMKTTTKDRSTIVQRLINGHNGIPPGSIVWGISATVQRFTDAMTAAQSEGRITYPAIQVDPRAVQESGLLKDTIMLDFPDEKGVFDTTLLRSALAQMREISALWATYTAKEQLPEPVIPLMVLQVQNSPKMTDLKRLTDVIHDEWPEIGPDGIANVFGEHTDLSLGNTTVRYIAPQHVQDAIHVRVLLAKDAVSTGWDCPRAEVLYSLRPATDRTHITQLLGRMVRTPLKRRIDSDERLNAVSCFLPYFNQPTAIEVAQILTGEKIDFSDPDSSSNKGLGRKALTSPVTMFWNSDIPEEVRAFLASLPSEAAPRGTIKPIRRLLSLAAEIVLDNLMSRPNEQAMETLFRVIDGQIAQNRDEVNRGIEGVYSADIRRITSSISDRTFQESIRQERADDRTINDAFRTVSRALGIAIANGYVKRLALSDDADDFDVYAAKAQMIALLNLPGVVEAIEATAEATTNDWLNALRVRIRGLSEERRSLFEEITLQARDPQTVEIVVPTSRIENTRDTEDNLLTVLPKHLLADEEGNFPVGALNPWEIEVVETELTRPETIAWYRNPSSPTSDALQVPYSAGNQWRSMQPDFLFFTRTQDGSLAASIVDPHGDHLADALPKLKGLVAFAENYGSAFLRIEAISQVDRKELRWLDLLDRDTRMAIQTAESATDLYRSGFARTYN